MSDIFNEVDEELRREKLEKLWKKYGSWLVAAAVAVVAVSGGTVMFRNWQEEQRIAATAAIGEQVRLLRAGPNAEIAKAMTGLSAELNDGGQLLARLYAAGLETRVGDKAQGAAFYTEIMNDASVDAVWRDAARYLLAFTQIDTGEPAALIATLEPLTQEGNAWRHLAREATALLAYRAGDKAKALALAEALSKDADAPQALQTRATELKAVIAAQ
jgi:hypothetical protein